MGSDALTLGKVRIEGEIGRLLGGATKVAAFVVTVGEELSCLVEEAWRAGDPLTAWMLDAFGSWAAETTAEVLMDCLRSGLGPDESLTLRCSPGYPGLDLSQQAAIFELVEANSIGVTLRPSCFMHPLKSISGLVGLLPCPSGAQPSPCSSCPELGCHRRR
jgi:cobalamin-dependent methionine synthase I